ncbi:MAG: hypothetical protein ACI9MC_001573 [Kiritimatiellia bacterium]|jgi:hypothetical protein
MRIFRYILIFSLLGSCAVRDNKLFVDLDDEQITEVCEEFDARVIECTDNTTVRYEFGCDAGGYQVSTSCYLTVGDYRACHQAIDLLSDEAFCHAGGQVQVCAALFSEDCLPR